MWPTTPEFFDALTQTRRQWAVKVEIIEDRRVVGTIGNVLDGAVRFSNTAIRRTCRFTFLDPDGSLMPVSDNDILAPRGTEVRIYKGLYIKPAFGEVEWVPLGTFVITEATIVRTEGQGAVIEITGSDRGDAVRRRLFRAPYSLADGTNVTAATTAIVSARYPTALELYPTEATVPELLYDAGDDPWAAIQEINQGANLYVYYDPMGVLTSRPNKTLGGEPTGVAYQTDSENGLVLDIERSILSDDVYSGVIIHVEHPDRDPIHIEVWDDDPDSATYYLGKFGRKPLVIETSTIKSEARAQTLAERLVKGVIAGFGTKVVRQRQKATLTTVGHPGHDVGDRVRVDDDSTKTKKWWIVMDGEVSLRSGEVTLSLLSGIGQEKDEGRRPLDDAEDTVITIPMKAARL